MRTIKPFVLAILLTTLACSSAEQLSSKNSSVQSTAQDQEQGADPDSADPLPVAPPPDPTPTPTPTPNPGSSPTPTPTPSSTPYPTAANGDLIVTFNELDGIVADHAVIAFGHIFKPGDYFPGTLSLKNLADGQLLPTQVNVLRKHDDGSIRHALLVAQIPQVGAKQKFLVQLLHQTPPVISGSFSYGFVPASLDAELKLTNASGTYRSKLRDVLADPTTCTLHGSATKASASWRVNGDLVRQCVAWDTIRNPNGTNHADLDISWRLTFFRDKQVKISLVVENSHVNKFGNTFQNYSFDQASLSIAGNAVWSYGPVHVHIGTRFALPKEFSYGQYLPELQMIPNYDYYVSDVKAFLAMRGPVFESELNQYATAPYTVSPGQMTTMAPLQFGQTGGGHHIGAFRTDERIFLGTFGRDAFTFMSGVTANQLGNVYDIHFRQSADATQQKPGGSIGIECGDWLAQKPNADSSAPGSPDTAHQPSKGFTEYVFNPLRLGALEEMEFWMIWGMASEWPYDCIIDNQNRAVAWGIRDLGRLLWILPDAHPMMSSYQQKLSNWLTHLTATTVGSGLPSGVNTPVGFESPYNLVVSAQPHEVNTIRTSRWQNAWFIWSLTNLVKLGFTQALPIAQWSALDIVDSFTVGDDPANNWKAPNGKTYTWKWQWSYIYRSPVYYYPESMPNTIACDTSAWTAPLDYHWIKTPVVNWGHRAYLQHVEYSFEGYPLPNWCPTYADGTPMTIWDPMKEIKNDPSWMQYGGEIGTIAVQELANHLSGSTWLGQSLALIQQKVNGKVAPRYSSYTQSVNKPKDFVYKPLH